MKHRAARSFRRAYAGLPEPIRNLADKNFELLERTPEHPSLRFKPVGKYWSVRVNRDFRALAVRDGEDFNWFWIGTHADYDKLLR